ncbi:MAG: leucine-rich repeat protein [Treponema sp.]|jgi:hypothetical protein|nr:leucine-rich repeat protein [Treponema sp.]
MKNRNLRTGSTAAALTAVVVALTFVLASCGDAGGGPGGTPPVYYTVNYSAGEGTGTAPASQTVLAGTTITLPGKGNLAAPIAEETFGGWSDGRLHAAGTPYTVNATVTLTAKWGFTGIDAITAYLGTVTGVAASPAPLRVLLNLADGTNGWAALLAGIQTAGDYVALDLSACAVTGMTATAGEFDADRTLTGGAKDGKGFVVSLVLPETATAIKAETEILNSAFQDFTALKTVCGANVITIGENAFRFCTGLVSLDFPKATTIGDAAFDDCAGLTAIAFPQVTTIGDNAFGDCDNFVSVDFPKATYIGDYAFGDCAAPSSVAFPEATYIGNGAFNGWTGLVSVDFPRATYIGNANFEDCTGLTSVAFPQATTIGPYVFEGCTGLVSVDLPKVTLIDDQAFQDTGTGPLTVTLGASPPAVGSDTFLSVTGGPKPVTVRVPSASIGSGTNQYNDDWKKAFRGVGNDVAPPALNDTGDWRTGTENTDVTVNYQGD